MRTIDFEIDNSGPKMRFGIWEAMQRPRSLADEIDAARKKLNVRDNAIADARLGLPPVDSDQPTGFELRVENTWRLLADEHTQAAEARMAGRGTELAQLAAQVKDSDFTTIKTRMSGALINAQSRVAAKLPRPMRKWVVAETDLKAFLAQNRTAGRPEGSRPFLYWVTTASATAIAEALVNGLLFRNELGQGPGTSFALVVGLSLAAIGTAGGIGIAQLKRRQNIRKVIGGFVLATAVIVGGAYMLAMGHYRDALTTGAENPAAVARASFDASLFAPLSDFSMVPFLILNLVGIAIIAWESIKMFSWMDLKSLQKDHDDALAHVEQIKSAAYQRTDEIGRGAAEAASQVVATVHANADRGQAVLTECSVISRRNDVDVDRISGALVESHQEYREIVGYVHMGRGKHKRFKIKPQRLAAPNLPTDPRFAMLVTAIDARSASLAAALPVVLEEIDGAKSTAFEAVAEQIADIEAAARSDRGVVQNIFRFMRRK